MFRYRKSIPVPYDQQGYIYFASRRWGSRPGREQRRILRLCTEAGGEHYRALYEYVTRGTPAAEICGKHYISQSTLDRMTRRYYVLFARTL